MSYKGGTLGDAEAPCEGRTVAERCQHGQIVAAGHWVRAGEEERP